MSIVLLRYIAMASAVWMCTATANQCQIIRSAPQHIEMQNGMGVLAAGINGSPVRLTVSTETSFSILSMAAAQRLHLPLRHATYNIGSSPIAAYVAQVRTLSIFGYQVHKVRLGVFRVAPAPVDGTLGEDVLRLTDVEYDFANGIMRLVVPKNCDDQSLAYWAAAKRVPMIKLEPDSESGHIGWITGWVRVNGVRLRAVFASDHPDSVLSRGAARRVGVGPGSPGVKPISSSSGTGAPTLWSAPIATFQIGGETIEHAHLLVAVGPTDLGVDLVIGSDFFQSHHIYVANGQHRMYMTYNGGPVFALDVKELHKPQTGAADSSAR